MFRASILTKSFLAILIGMLPIVLLMAAFNFVGVGRGFLRYVNAVELTRLDPAVAALEAEHGRARGWAGIPRDPGAFAQWIAAAMQADAERRGPPPPPPRPYPPPEALDPARAAGGPLPWQWRPPEGPGVPPPPRLDLPGRAILLDADGARLVGPPHAHDASLRRPLTVAGEAVGYLAISQHNVLAPDLERWFLAEQRLSIVVSVVAGGLLAAIIAWGLAVHLRRPIRALVAGTLALAGGAYATRIAVSRTDELGVLARSFNQLGEALERHDASRRQWVADTSHELRTPITVLRAQIEAMQDGVRPADPANLAVLKAEILALGRLVDDLHTLARADVGQLDYRFARVDALAVLDDVIARFGPRLALAGLDLAWAGRPARPVAVWGDPDRLVQLFAGLLDNALRYTDRGGRIALTAEAAADRLVIHLDDSPPGVGPDQLGLLFDRFYRTDASRNRERGGSGLGLAICRTLVDAHHGRIEASHSPLGGLRITIDLAQDRSP